MSEVHEPGETFVVQPGTATSFWQPVPANGHIEVALDPSKVKMDNPLAFGTQTVPPGGYVR